MSQLIELQRGLNSLSHQCRLQQEDHFELERRLMEMKFGQDPMMLSSDSVFGDGVSASHSIMASPSISMQHISLNASPGKNTVLDGWQHSPAIKRHL